ncbi:MAG: FtsH protease activity modulator HflK [Planctomycetota bacterium]
MDLEDLFEQPRRRQNSGDGIGRFFGGRRGGGRNGGFGGFIIGGLILAGIVFWTMMYRVDASDQGIVLRFGEHVRTVDPGLQLKMPWPIEKVYTVPVKRVQTIEFGFQTLEPGRRTEYALPSSETNEIADMLTGDLNLAHVEWIVQYKIQDAYKSLFNLGGSDGMLWESLAALDEHDINPSIPDAIQDTSETVMRQLVGDRSVDAVLTLGREEIAAQAKLKIQEMLDEFDAGVEIITVKLQSTSPPEPVRDAFQEVNRARQNKERVVNQAEGERNRQIPAARGRRDQMISEAEGYRERIVLETMGQIEAFNAKLAEYEKAPEITRQRLYLEAMEEVLGNIGNKTIIDEAVGGALPILNLNAGENPLRQDN